METEKLQTDSGKPASFDEGRKSVRDTLAGAIREHAANSPDALALKAGNASLTYRELDRSSNQLANYLYKCGVKAGNVVGICLERSIEFPVAALAILKLGCAYLPLESKTPVVRLQTMLKGAGVPLVVTLSAFAPELAGIGARLVALDGASREIGNCSSEFPIAGTDAGELAYVIYTSGSTGNPKAVAIGHGGLLNLCRWHNRVFGITAQDRATQFASIGFDAAVWEVWPHLMAGASVHIVDEAERSQPERLREWLTREKITISFVPTPVAEQMLKLKWPKKTALRFLLTGADTLHEHPPSGLPFTLVNNYGPTECTVVATSGAVPPRRSAERLPSIGEPIDHTRIFILDEKMQSVPAGTMGEIYVGGAGLAQGYLNDAQLTAERFVRDPFSSDPGARLYRTGDLGCFLGSGEIEFHGRADDQVKIRGHRIELNEVTGVLKRHPAVRDAAIVAHGNGNSEKQLVAYVVADSASPAVGELRNFLAKELPEYMLPAAFVMLERLPLSSNGKIDRSALPLPRNENILREKIAVEPSTPTEQRVAAIVASLLGLNQLGVDDNFFYLGGNSLFGTQVIARLRDAFNVEIPLLKLFDRPTVAELAAEVDRMIVARVEAMSEEEARRLVAQQANV